MGNRGILHDDQHRLGPARWRHHAWVTCALSFKGRRRELMAPGRYTELFFTDEAVALAAGHRPCAECRRTDFERFRSAFEAAHPELGTPVRAPVIDRMLHRARVKRSRDQVTFLAASAGLPDGVFFRVGADCLVQWQGRVWVWGFEGYWRWSGEVPEQVEVLTPEPSVRVIAAGYVPFCAIPS